jgi:FAD/FMN-containing dehydrogenase
MTETSLPLLGPLRSIVGAGNVLTGPDAAPYGREWTGKYHWQPLAVVRPGSTAEVSAVLALASRTGTPVVPVSGRTGLTGAAEAEGRLMLSLERMNRIREIRRDARIAIVESGAVLSSIHDAAAREDMVFPLTFGARGSAMIGGCLATNAGGSNVVRYGSTRALCLGLEVVLADGRVVNLMSELHKDNSGYDLRDLFIGSEGTLGIITAAVLRLFPKPRAYATALIGMGALGPAIRLLRRLQEVTGGGVEAFEFMPDTYMDRLALCRPDLKSPLARHFPVNILVEAATTSPRDATPDAAGTVPLTATLEAELAAMIEAGEIDDATVAASEAQRRRLWAMREAAAEITVGRHPIVDCDVALPVDRVEQFLAAMKHRLAALDPGAEEIVVCHLGDGNIHYSAFPARDDGALCDRIREEVDGLAVALGGSFSAEHGVGLSKQASMARLKDPVALDLMERLKAAFDPAGILNPGKVIP